MSVRISASYILGGSLFSKLISFAGSIALARILYPEDYAYVLIASIFTGFVNILGNVGFENYYLQARFINEEEEDTTLRITSFLRLGLNSILFLIQFGLSYIIELYYQQLIVGQLLRIFSFGYLITGFGVTSQFILRRELNFKPESIANVCRDLAGTLVKVVCALSGLGALSFAVGSVVGNFLRVLIILRARYYVPFNFRLNREVLNKILYFGKHSFVGGIGLYLVQQSDKFLLSRFYPKEVIGFYHFSSSQAEMVYNYLIHPLSGLLLSFFAKHKENPQHLYSVILKISFLISAIILPITIILFFHAYHIFEMVFGEKWRSSVPLFQLFLVYNYLTLFVYVVGGVLTAFGYPDINAKLIWMRGTTLFVFLAVVSFLEMPIFVYASVFLFISFVFSWIKAYLCVAKLGSSLLHYITSQKAVLYSSIGYYCVLMLSELLFTNLFFSISIGLAGVVIIFFVINIFWFRNDFIDSIKLVVGNNAIGLRILHVLELLGNRSRLN